MEIIPLRVSSASMGTSLQLKSALVVGTKMKGAKVAVLTDLPATLATSLSYSSSIVRLVNVSFAITLKPNTLTKKLGNVWSALLARTCCRLSFTPAREFCSSVSLVPKLSDLSCLEFCNWPSSTSLIIVMSTCISLRF